MKEVVSIVGTSFVNGTAQANYYIIPSVLFKVSAAASTVTGEDIDNSRKRRTDSTAHFQVGDGEESNDIPPADVNHSGPAANSKGWQRQLFGRGEPQTIFHSCMHFLKHI